MTTTVSVPCNDVMPKSDYFLDIYGTSKVPDSTVTNRLANGHNALKKTRTVIHLSLRDSLPAYGPIASMTFSLAKNGVGRLFSTITYYIVLIDFSKDRPVPELVAATGSGLLGGFTLFQVALPYLTCRLFSLSIYIFTCSVIFRCLPNARYMPSAEPADSGHCPSVNLSRLAGSPTKNQ
jgi:cleavage and polyadenylation specificity factor subunit 1